MKIENLVTISLTIFLIAVITILGYAAVSSQEKTNSALSFQENENEDENKNSNPAPSQSVNPPQSTNQSGAITLAEVAKHNSVNNCWVTVNSKIYNVTSIISSHPGGQEAVISQCGKDATAAFTAKIGSGHSQNAQNILSQLYVGNITR